MNEEDKISRRKVLGGLSAGLAVAAVGAIPAAEGAPAPADTAPEPLSDPTTKYPKPPFKSQS